MQRLGDPRRHASQVLALDVRGHAHEPPHIVAVIFPNLLPSRRHDVVRAGFLDRFHSDLIGITVKEAFLGLD